MDPKLSAAQADPHDDDDVVVLARSDWMDAEEALSKLAHIGSNSNRRPPRADADFSAGPRVTEPSAGPALRAADVANDPFPAELPPRGKRTSRGFARFLVAVCVGVAATLAWQSYGDTARQMIASSVPQLAWLLPPPAINSEIAVEPPTLPVFQASAPQAASVQGGAVAPTTAEAGASIPPAAPSPELQQQLAAMAHDLAAMRQSVEQLAAGQEQMAGDIAKLQAAEQDIRRRIAALPPTAVPTVRKPVPVPVPPPQVAPQSSAGPLPPVPPPPQVAPQSSSAPLPPVPGEPPRPPMPLR
jgi:hypothetical protein